MGMGYGAGQSIGGGGSVELRRGKKPPHHRLYLPLVGMSGTHNRLLDVIGSVFSDRQLCFRRGEKNDRPSMAEFKGSYGILRDECLFDRNRSRRVLHQDRANARMQRR